MTFRAEVLTTSLDVAPGDLVIGRLQVTNDGAADAEFGIDVVGLDDGRSGRASEILRLSIAAGEVGICEVPVHVPHAIGSGEHAAAFRVVSNEPGSRPTLSSFTLSVSSLAGLEMIASPSPVRGRRRASFHVDVVNNEAEVAAFTLVGEATDTHLKFARPTFDLAAGQRDTTRVKVRAKRLWRGEPRQHNLLVTAHGRASTATTTVPFVQRPVFAHTSRAIMAAAVVIALWVGAIAGVLAFLQYREDEAARMAAQDAAAASITGVDTDGDGVADIFYDANGLAVVAPEAVDFDGDGVADAFVDGSGRSIEVVTAVDTDGDGVADVFQNADGVAVRDPSLAQNSTGTADGGGGSDVGGSGDGGSGSDVDDGGDGPDQIASSITPETLADAAGVRPASVRRGPTSTSIGGTVSAAGNVDVTDTVIIVRPISLNGATTANPDVVAFAGERAGVPTKIWSARRPALGRGESGVRQTEPVIPLESSPTADGVWRVSDVDLFRSYEVSFAKAGFDTQSFVLTPPDDGEPVELDVELQPASGAIRGRIIGPGGPIGGADVTITDGTLVFETTAATSGDIGAFILERVSTPGVYTLSVSLRGFGTEVVQVELGEGEQRTGIDIVIRRGVGTVSGRIVDEAGQPLAGASITATNGDTERSTSSLTEGDVGFYSIPQLDVATPQTINVTLPGYTTQTRRIPGGTTGGVNFVMVRTTSTISGQVNSSDGGGIIAAGVTLTNGELEFRAATTNAPAGFFAVDDLPPGNYTVTIDHFEHATATEFVVVQEGTDPAPLAITLEALDEAPSVGTGELVVEAINPNAETAEMRPVPATVTLVETRTGDIFPTETEPEETVRISAIPPGTYTLTVKAEGYADSAPRQVSIGLQSERREVELLRKGAAGGRMVDSLTGDPVGPYVLDLFLVIGNDLAEVGSVPSRGDGTWETPAFFLEPGEYRIGVAEESAPRGYRVLEDQLLDPDADGLMRFVVDPFALETNEVRDIEADPFPDIEGRVFTPRLVAGTVTELDPIDSASLQAVLRCTGNSNQVVATVDDLAGAGTTPAPLFDSFSIAKELVDDQSLIGDCRIDLTADTYVAASIPLPSLQPSDGFLDNDRITNAAMYAPVDTIGGSVFWIDDRPGAPNPVLLDAVDIATNAIVSFPPEDAPPPPPGQEPDVERRDLSTTSSSGAWALSGQVFGPATYRVNEEGFAPTSFEVVIDESRDRVVTALPDITMTPASPATAAVGADTQYAIELNAPFAGSVNGRVTILTEDVGNEEFANVGIEAFRPLGRAQVPTTRVLRPAVDDGSFVVTGASAGTWDVEFALPDNHIFHTFGGASNLRSDRVDPGEDQVGYDTTLVDLATVNVRATDPGPTAAPAPTTITSEMNVSLRPSGGGGVAQDPPAGNAPQLLTDVVVDLASPVGVAVPYLLDVELRGFDPTTADVFINGQLATSGSITDLPVSVVAGRDVDVEIRIRPFGSIIGVIDGAVEPPAITALEPLDVVSPGGTGRATIGITAVDVAGVRDPSAEAREREAAVLVEPTATAGVFRVQGPAGFYEFDVAHPEYDTVPLATAFDSLIRRPDPLLPPIGLPVNVFELRTDTTNTLAGTYVLGLRQSTLRIDVVDDLVSRNPVAAFTYTLTPQFGGGGATVAASTQSSVSVVGLTPGMYSLRIDDGSNRFPFISDVMIRRSDAAATKVTIVTVPLPVAGATITGVVAARNSGGALVALPPVTLTRTYLDDVSGVVGDDQGGAEIPVTNGSVATDDIGVSSPAGQSTYNFTNAVAVGFHTLSLTDTVGYTTPADARVEVEQAGGLAVDPTVPELTYTVPDVTATVQIDAVTNGEFTNLTIELFDPGVAPPPPATGRAPSTVTGPVTSRTATFTAVPPDLRPYTLRITDPLYGTQDFPVLVRVDVDGVGTPEAVMERVDPILGPVVGPISPNGVLGRVTGVLTQNNGGSVAPLDQASTVTLTPDGGAAIPIVPGVDGSYSADVAAGPYTLAIAERPADGFSGATTPVTVTAGTISPLDLQILDLAEVNVTITSPTVLPAGTIVQLEAQGTSTRIDPVTGTQFFVSPGQYRIVVSGTYPETFFPGGNQYFGVNATGTTRSISLPRLVAVDVSNPPPGLVVRVGGATDSDAPYSFSSPTIAAGGPLTIEYDYPAADQTVAGGQTDAALTFTTAVTFTTLNGDITTAANADGVVVPEGTLVTAISGTVTLSGEVGAGNTYSIDGLVADLTSNGSGNRTWALRIDEPGFGIGVGTVTVNRATGPTITQDIDMDAEEYIVTFDVQSPLEDPPGTPVAPIDSNITLTGATALTANTFRVRETQGDLDWTVTEATGTLVSGSPASSTVMGTFDASAQRVAPPTPITVSYAQVPLTGEVVGSALDHVIEVCAGPAAGGGPCTVVRGPTPGGTGPVALSYAPIDTPGTYHVRVTIPAPPAVPPAMPGPDTFSTLDFTIRDDGSVTIGVANPGASAVTIQLL